MREDSQLCFSSVSQPCPTLCNPMICSTPGLPVHHQLPKFTQTHAHRMLMPSSHLILCRPLLLLPPIPPSIRVFSNESTLRMRWPKYWIHCVFETSSVTDYWQKFFGVFFFFLFSIACQGTQPYHAMCSNSNQPPLCWTVGWTWLPPWISFLCHLFKGMYWRIWDGISFSWLKDGPQ